MRLLVAGGLDGQVALALSRLKTPDVEIVVRGKPEGLDLLDPKSMAASVDAVKPDAVACVGAYTAVDEAESKQEFARQLNADGPAELAKLCAARGLPIIQISTDYVFDGTKTSPYVETDAPAPLTVYGATKLGGEQGVAAAGGRHAILRVSWVFAAEGKNFVRTMLRLAKTRERLGVVDDQTGYPTYAPFIAEAVVGVARQMVAKPDAPSGVFHCTGEGATTWCSFARAIFTQSRRVAGPAAEVDAITTAQYPTPAKRPANSVLDTRKIAAAYGIRLPHWRAGLDDCLAKIAAGGWDVG
jgi:dTDP-4-dehydrorhamnose reductase